MTDQRRHCPNCHARIHPLELSDLFRGRRLNCSSCGRGLSAGVAWWAAVPLGAVFAGVLFYFAERVEGPFWLGIALGAAMTWILTWLIQSGLLIEGAPWVTMSARDKPWPSRRSWFGIRLD